MFALTILFFAFVSADELKLYDEDGTLQQGMQIIDPLNLKVSCVREKDKRWIGIGDMKNGDYIVMTNLNNDIPTKVQGETNKYYKTLKFTSRYNNDNVNEISLNVKMFPTDFNTVYNENLIDSIKGYPVKVKNDKNSKISILVNNFSLNEKVNTIIFTRQNATQTDPVNLRLTNIRLDTDTTETQMYENGASQILCTFLLGAIFFLLF